VIEDFFDIEITCQVEELLMLNKKKVSDDENFHSDC